MTDMNLDAFGDACRAASDDELARLIAAGEAAYPETAWDLLRQEFIRRRSARREAELEAILAGPEDAGARGLAFIYKTLQIDDEWAMWFPRAFTWQGYRLAQAFEVSEPFEDLEHMISRITVDTHVIHDVKAAREKVVGALDFLNRLALGSAWIFDEGARSILLSLATNLHAGNVQWRASHVANLANLQLIEAEQVADVLAEAVNGTVAVRQHAVNGARTSPDATLGWGQLVLDGSGERSLFAVADEMAGVSRAANAPDMNAFSAGSDAGGAAFEVPFGPDDTALVEFRTDEAHPRWGHGLLVTEKLRFHLAEDRAKEEAQRLNRMMRVGRHTTPFCGAWASLKLSERDWTVAFSSFHPNVFFRPTYAMSLVTASAYRLATTDRFYFPGLPVRPIADIVRRRMESALATLGQSAERNPGEEQ